MRLQRRVGGVSTLFEILPNYHKGNLPVEGYLWMFMPLQTSQEGANLVNRHTVL